MRRSEYNRAINKYQFRFFREHLNNICISKSEVPYLRKIHRAGGKLPMNDVVGESFYHKSHATRAINRLVKDGLLIKEKNPDDLRAFVVSLTEKGKAISEKVEKAINEWDELIYSVMTDEDKEVLNTITKKIFTFLKDYYNEEDCVNETNI